MFPPLPPLYAALASVVKPVAMLVATVVGGAVVGVVAVAAAIEGADNLALIWGAILGSIGITALATLWKMWLRTRRIAEYLIDKGFDNLEARIGMERGELTGPEFPTPIDALGKSPGDETESSEDDE